MTKRTFYVTTAIDYPSGNPHIGHAYEKTAADVLARWNRSIGNETFLLCGVDEHGQKIVEKAEEENLKPEDFVAKVTPKFQEMLKTFNISNDFFIRTTDKKHKEFVQKMLKRSFENGDIYKGEYEGLYCVGCERYYDQNELDENLNCTIHKKPVKKVKEENYFFRLSKYQNRLLELYEKNPDFISPKSKRSEMINRIKEGLRDISISRRKETLSWGIEIPFDENHVTYVWFDALFNYYSGVFINNKEYMWPADVHIIGHDISWFHVVYWPAFLMSVEVEVPKKIFSHGMILAGDGHKMSKSLGNVVDPFEVINRYGLDEIRFFLMGAGTFGDDVPFNEEVLVNKINNDLNNDLGNLVSRVHSMTGKYFYSKVPKIENLEDIDIGLLEKINIYNAFDENIQELRFNNAIELLWGAIRETNAYINAVSPWKVEDKKRLGTIMNILCSCVVYFAKYIGCLMPSKAEMVFRQFNIENDKLFKVVFFDEGHELYEKENLFQKVILEKKDDVKEEEITPFESLSLRVGKIVEIRNHPEADKLYIEKIDIGEKEPRQIISGLKDHYAADELLNKKVIVVTNLKPAKLRGEISQGMILAAEDKKGNVGLVTTEEDIGTALEWEEKKADSEKIITIDQFFEIKMRSDGKKVTYQDKEVKVKGESLIIDKSVSGKIR